MASSSVSLGRRRCGPPIPHRFVWSKLFVRTVLIWGAFTGEECSGLSAAFAAYVKGASALRICRATLVRHMTACTERHERTPSLPVGDRWAGGLNQRSSCIEMCVQSATVIYKSARHPAPSGFHRVTRCGRCKCHKYGPGHQWRLIYGALEVLPGNGDSKVFGHLVLTGNFADLHPDFIFFALGDEPFTGEIGIGKGDRASAIKQGNL